MHRLFQYIITRLIIPIIRVILKELVNYILDYFVSKLMDYLKRRRDSEKSQAQTDEEKNRKQQMYDDMITELETVGEEFKVDSGMIVDKSIQNSKIEEIIRNVPKERKVLKE